MWENQKWHIGESMDACACACRLTLPGIFTALALSLSGAEALLTSWRLRPDGWNRQKRGLSVPNKMPFSVLCGIALTSLSAPANGGLVVYPGSHHVIGAHIARMIAEPQLADLDGDELAAALDGKLPDLKSVAPVKVPMEPGDIVLVHPRVAHRSAPNAGCNVRMTAYFRLKTAECGAVNECNRRLLADPWKDFQGDGVASAGRAAAAAVEAASDGWEAV